MVDYETVVVLAIPVKSFIALVLGLYLQNAFLSL